jgi:phenylalanyl-tRNA synthetase alpha chain
VTNSLKETIEAVRKSFLAALDSFPSDHIEIETLKNNYFGRKGELAKLYAQMGSVAPKDRPDVGKAINALKEECFRLFEDEAKKYISSESTRDDVLDYTLPGEIQRLGSTHPISKTLKEIKDIFTSVGFHITYGPEIDDDYHNFTALNFPEHHPARDMQDTFFVQKDVVLRTHTSNVQIHLMESSQPPLRYIVPGRVYRNEAISFKSYCLFHQIEGIVVDKHISFGDLKGTLEYFVKRVFGSSVKMRFRPSFFPFTEPSAEVDIWDEKRGEWLEILGCGMVDPAVFENVGYDPNIWHGYAFGLGIERIAMLKYGISDIRLFFQNDKRFLDQF